MTKINNINNNRIAFTSNIVITNRFKLKKLSGNISPDGFLKPCFPQDRPDVSIPTLHKMFNPGTRACVSINIISKSGDKNVITPLKVYTTSLIHDMSKLLKEAKIKNKNIQSIIVYGCNNEKHNRFSKMLIDKTIKWLSKKHKVTYFKSDRLGKNIDLQSFFNNDISDNTLFLATKSYDFKESFVSSEDELKKMFNEIHIAKGDHLFFYV